jgi:hypothetical protein
VVEKQAEATKTLNVSATGFICQAAGECVLVFSNIVATENSGYSSQGENMLTTGAPPTQDRRA